MKKAYKTKNAFTMAEVMVVFTIIAVVVVATTKIINSQVNYATRYQYYAAFNNLKQAIGNIVADGYLLDGSTTVHTGIPNVWNSDAATTTTPMGLCKRLTRIMNIIGADACGLHATSGFKTVTPSFITTNGMRYFISDEASTGPYTIYIDINGKKGDGETTKDVQAFTVTLDGIVRPASLTQGAINKNYLSTSLRYWDSVNNKYVIVKDGAASIRGVSYQQAVCQSGEVTGLTVPVFSCTNGGTTYTQVADCTTNVCEVVINPPGL